MKRNTHAGKAGLIALVGVLGACEGTVPPLPKHTKGYYSNSTLGDLPEKPKMQGLADVVSLVQGGGETPEYRTKVATILRSGDKMTCKLKAGEVISAIGDAGDHFLVHAEKSSLSEPCANSGDAEYVEGYVEKRDLEFYSEPQTPQTAQTAQTEQTISSGSSPSGETAASTSTSMSNSCSSVKYGSKVDDGSKKIQKLIAKKAKKNKIPGKLWRQGGEQFFLQIAGQADKWKVQAFDKTKKRTMAAKVIDSSTLEKAENNEVVLPFQLFVEDPNEWKGVDIEVVLTPQSKAGVEGSSTCVQKISLASPLVLDFSGKNLIQTKSLSSSRVSFDMDADGQLEQVGWISGRSAAFLVLDLNENGKIDDASEMFGEATKLNQTNAKAPEGFAALTQYDTNADGKIDTADRIFPKLKLWFDKNGNGQTDAGELETLANREVSAISLKYTSLPRSQALQHVQSIPNDVRTSATFSAKGCPASGCKVYDIFFGMAKSRIVSQK